MMLPADEGEGGPGRRDAGIRAALSVGEATVRRVRKRAVEEGPEAAWSASGWPRVSGV